MLNHLQATIIGVMYMVMSRWIDEVWVVGHVNLASVQIGQDVILSCQVIGCRSPSWQLHLYKWEGLANRTISIQSSSGERDKNDTQKGQYMNGVLEVPLSQVKQTDAGKYVCALICEDAYKEDIMEVKLRHKYEGVDGDINTSVGEEVLLPCPLIVEYGSSYLKMHWRRLRPGKSQNIYSYLYQETCPVVYSEDSLGDRCSSNRSSRRIWFQKKYKQKLEVFKGNEFGNRNGYLKLKNIQKEDAGEYLCSVTSESFHKKKIFQISVKGIQDQEMDSSITYFLLSLLCILCLLCLLIMERCFARSGETVREERKLDDEVGQWQSVQEELTKLHSEVDKLTEDNRQWQREIEWRRACSYADNITLDEDSAHPNLSIAADKKSCTYETGRVSAFPNPQHFDGTVAVLARKGFSSGRHYWTVEISNSTEWDLGVARRAIERKGQCSLSPKEGFWVLGRSGRDYWAKTDPWTRVNVQRQPSKIGVYLSFEEKKVTFFNVGDMSVLFVFKNCSFSGEIFPFFKNTEKGTTIRICSIKEEEA